MSSQTRESADIGAEPENKCPYCSSPNYIEIVYGDPTHEAFVKSKRGEAILAGCCISEKNSPRHICKNCRHKY